jgi:hypothetical protein
MREIFYEEKEKASTMMGTKVRDDFFSCAYSLVGLRDHRVGMLLERPQSFPQVRFVYPTLTEKIHSYRIAAIYGPFLG